jgi:hypothetical protein
MDKRLVITYGHIDEGSRKELVQPSSISEFRGSRHGASRNFTTGIPKCRNDEMQNAEIPGIETWSIETLHHRSDETLKYLFGVGNGYR